MAKISRSCKGSWVRIKENKPKGKNMNKKTKTKFKKCAKKTKMATSRFKPTPWPPSTRETSSKTTGPGCRWITNRSQVFANRRMFMFVKVLACMPTKVIKSQDQKQVRVFFKQIQPFGLFKDHRSAHDVRRQLSDLGRKINSVLRPESLRVKKCRWDRNYRG